MEDRLFFSKQHVRLRDLAQLADEYGYRHAYVDVAADGEEWLNIYYEDERLWQWIPLPFEAEAPGWQPEERSIIEAYVPAASYLIAHYPPFARSCMATFSGFSADTAGGLMPGEAGSREPRRQR